MSPSDYDQVICRELISSLGLQMRSAMLRIVSGHPTSQKKFHLIRRAMFCKARACNGKGPHHQISPYNIQKFRGRLRSTEIKL